MNDIERNSILVIDDDPSFRELIGMMGNAFGLQVLQAPDCCAGMQVLERERAKIRLVLLDYFMPGLTPVECASGLIALATDISIVLVTAAVDPSQRAAELKLSRWLSKPFNIEDLERLIKP